MNAYSDRPDIMAIGDSMYQGIRSLSLLPAMMPHSAPMQVSTAIGMDMVAPDPKVPLLFDMEAELRHGGLLHLVSHIRNICINNLKSWPFDQPWSQHEAFDNIAIGGATIASLWQDTYGGYIDRAKSLATNITDTNLSTAELAEAIGDLWFALNICYTLNPQHREEQKAQSQLAQATDRQPQILLVNIGSNEGLFRAGFAGDLSAATIASVKAIPDKMRELADRMKALPARTERIVFNSLIRPRFIPNLMPNPADENKFPGDLYYAAYGPRISSTQQDITGAQLKDFDDVITAVNGQTEAIMRAALGNRVVFADIYGESAPFDGKHYIGRGLHIPASGTILNNKPITPIPFGYYGGFAGLDNMHPTVPGYAIIADAVLDALGRSAIRTDKAAAFAADTLLNNVRGLPLLIAEAELSLLGTFGVFKSSTTPTA